MSASPMKIKSKEHVVKSLPTLVLLATALSLSAATTRYVNLNNPNPVPPFTDWATAATNIQDAVDAAVAGDEIVVTNGVYATGGRAVYSLMTNRVAVDKPVTVRSINGPKFTIIQGRQVPGTTNGDGAIRCAYLADGAVLSGFTVTNGATRRSGYCSDSCGGGVWCAWPNALVTNCIISENSANYEGGGAHSGTLFNCTVSRNHANTGAGTRGSFLYNCRVFENSAYVGGGAYFSTFNNCTIVGNIATYQGGGVFGGFLTNCIIWLNNSLYPSGPEYFGGTFSFCCTWPFPPGAGNISLDPKFIDWRNGDLHFQSNSPCINAGNNAYVSSPIDLDGNPRIVGGTVDIGAYEFQSPASQLSYAWLQQYGLPTDGSADFTDPDGDRANNWQEWQSATVPTNALSALRLLTPQTVGTNLVVSWQSVANKLYYLERSTALATNASFLPLASNLVGQAGFTTFTDTNAAPAGSRFYRVGVQ